jgi:site-specific recombinase XerC
MPSLKKFTKLMKGVVKKNGKRSSFRWTVSENRVFSPDEHRRLRKACLRLKREGLRRKSFSLVRDWFMVELGLYAGLRVEEMSLLKVKDFVVDGERSSVSVRRGKCGRPREVWVNSKFKKLCREFLQIREKFGFRNERESFVMVSSSGRPVRKRALQRAFKRCIKKAGLPDWHSIHNLRHTYGTYLLEATGNPKFVQDQLGHSSLTTTQVYLRLLESTKLKIENLYRFSRESKA